MASIFSVLKHGAEFLRGLRKIPEVRAKVEQWERESRTTISILVTGKTGTGKSTIINGIVGREVAKRGHGLAPETTVVKSYSLTEGEISVEVFDSPGLQDGTQNEPQYLADMKKKCTNVDLVVYCIRMSEDRVLPDGPDVRAMKKLDVTFGHEMWRNTIFLLTFANDVVDCADIECDNPEDQQQYFIEQVKEWDQLLRKRLTETVGVPDKIVKGIQITPAGHKRDPTLPDDTSQGGQSYWLSKVWLKAVGSTKPAAQLALIKLNLHRLHDKSEQYTDDDQMKLISQHKLIFGGKGSEIAKELGIPAGEDVGEIAGLLAGRDSLISTLVWQLMIKCGLVSQEDVTKITADKNNIK